MYAFPVRRLDAQQRIKNQTNVKFVLNPLLTLDTSLRAYNNFAVA